jgi:hypothetical protein
VDEYRGKKEREAYLGVAWQNGLREVRCLMRWGVEWVAELWNSPRTQNEWRPTLLQVDAPVSLGILSHSHGHTLRFPGPAPGDCLNRIVPWTLQGPLRHWHTCMIVELFLREGDGGS